MPTQSLEQAIPAAFRRAAQTEPSTGQGWTVRIVTDAFDRELRLGSQAQVAHLALELERLGLVLQVDDGADVDFVFAAEAVAPGAG